MEITCAVVAPNNWRSKEGEGGTNWNVEERSMGKSEELGCHCLFVFSYARVWL